MEVETLEKEYEETKHFFNDREIAFHFLCLYCCLLVKYSYFRIIDPLFLRLPCNFTLTINYIQVLVTLMIQVEFFAR